MMSPQNHETLSEFRSRIGSTIVADLMRQFPDSKPVLYNHFGASCFECPAVTAETIAFAIRVHDSLEDEFYADLAESLQIGLDEDPNP